MSKIVTPEMVSAFVDGELSPEDNLLVENALLADSALRDIAEGYQMLRSSLHSSSEYVTSTVQLPQQFTSSIMEKIQRLPEAVGPDDHHSKSGSPVVDRVQLADQASDFSVANSKRLTTMSSVYSIRTLVEVLVATVAVAALALAAAPFLAAAVLLAVKRPQRSMSVSVSVQSCEADANHGHAD